MHIYIYTHTYFKLNPPATSVGSELTSTGPAANNTVAITITLSITITITITITIAITTTTTTTTTITITSVGSELTFHRSRAELTMPTHSYSYVSNQGVPSRFQYFLHSCHLTNNF